MELSSFNEFLSDIACIKIFFLIFIELCKDIGVGHLPWKWPCKPFHKIFLFFLLLIFDSLHWWHWTKPLNLQFQSGCCPIRKCRITCASIFACVSLRLWQSSTVQINSFYEHLVILFFLGSNTIIIGPSRLALFRW